MKLYRTIKIENAKTTFFESKEQYLQFRQNWKQFIKDGKHLKKCPGTTTACFYDKHTGRYNFATVELRHESELTFIHHLIYNLLCGKTFKVLVCENERKQSTQWKLYRHITLCKTTLNSYLSLQGKKTTDSYINIITLKKQQLLAPFGDTVTVEQLHELMCKIDSNINNWEQLGEQ